MPSASGFPLLFGHFVGTSRPSDFPSTCMLDFWITSFSNRPVHNCVSGVDGTSRFSHVKFPCMLGVFDRAEPDGCSHFAFAGVAFRTLEQRRHSDFRPLSRLNTLPACSPHSDSGKSISKEISTVVVARACLWKCGKFEFADRLHWRRQVSRGHEICSPNTRCLMTDFQPWDALCWDENSDTVR